MTSLILGLDQITSEPALSPVVSRQRKTSKSPKHCRRVLQDEEDSTGDEDYKPQDTPGTHRTMVNKLASVLLPIF